MGWTCISKPNIGLAALAERGTTLPEETLNAAYEADGIVLGPVSTFEYPPREQGGVNPSGALRKALDLYANIRPAVSRAALSSARRPMDLVIVRENTEGFYADRNMFEGSGEFRPEPDIALSIRKITRRACRRIAEQAFSLAAGRPARHVTAVHKANVLQVSDGLFLEEVRAVAAEHSDIDYDEIIVDAMAAHLVRTPEKFDVVVTTNMYGDILSDLASELAGGLGLAGSLNAGSEHAMAQAQHGSAPDIAGCGIANPVALILSGAMLLDWLAHRRREPKFAAAAKAIRGAVTAALSDPETRPPDLGGTASTDTVGQAVARFL